MAEEENLSLEESGLVLERGSRRARKEEPKLSDVCIPQAIFCISRISYSIFTLCLSQTESPSNASIPELERQIDKLTKVNMLQCFCVYAALYSIYL